MFSSQFLVISDQTPQHLFYYNQNHKILLYYLFNVIVCPGHLIGIHPETISARFWGLWVSPDISETESPQCPKELGQNSNFVSLSTSQILSCFTQAPLAIILVKSGFLRAVLRTATGAQKSTYFLEGGNNLPWKCKDALYPPVINAHTFLTDFVTGVINPETLSVLIHMEDAWSHKTPFPSEGSSHDCQCSQHCQAFGL